MIRVWTCSNSGSTIIVSVYEFWSEDWFLSIWLSKEFETGDDGVDCTWTLSNWSNTVGIVWLHQSDFQDSVHPVGSIWSIVGGRKPDDTKASSVVIDCTTNQVLSAEWFHRFWILYWINSSCVIVLYPWKTKKYIISMITNKIDKRVIKYFIIRE